jgi:hypothetical protein
VLAISAIMFLLVLLGAGFLILRRHKLNNAPEKSRAEFAMRLARVRSAPTVAGSTVVGILHRGDRVSGQWVTSPDGVTSWFKTSMATGGFGYVWARNLSVEPRPAIVDATAGPTTTTEGAAVHADPSATSEIIQNVGPGAVVQVAATVEGGWRELEMSGGGVGYAPALAFAPSSPSPSVRAGSLTLGSVSGNAPNDPSFAAFPTGRYDGPIVMPAFAGSQAHYRMFRTVLREGAQRGPVFAGNLAVVQVGCGTDCSSVWVIDVRDGEVHDFPLGGEEYYDLTLEFRVNSRLMKAHWSSPGQTDPACAGTEALEWTGSGFRVLQTHNPAPRCAAQ